MGILLAVTTINAERAMFDEDKPETPKIHEIGMPLETLSVTELEERVGLLEAEIDRLHAAITAKSASRTAADAVFKFSK